MTDKLDAPWLSDPGAVAVMAALNGSDADSARFVGGCVRNALMGLAVDDIDIATILTPDLVIDRLKANRIRAIPTGIDHGTVTAVVDGKPYEITTLREDVETDGRRAVVRFTSDWSIDAGRRDFRLNAVYAGSDGTLFDPTGSGIEDAGVGRVVFIGEADERLREDYLRILRFFRFNAWYGQSMDSDGLAACERQVGGLSGIAAERIWKEFEKLLRAPDPRQSVAAMRSSGVLEAILPELRPDLTVFDQRVAQDREVDLTADPLQRLMTLVPKDLSVVASLRDRLRLSNAETDRLQAWASDASDIGPDLSDSDMRRLLYRNGAQTVWDRIGVTSAELAGAVPAAAWQSVRSQIEDYQRPVLPVGGEDVVAAGIPRGPKVGQVLKQIEDWWVEEDFISDKSRVDQRLHEIVRYIR